MKSVKNPARSRPLSRNVRRLMKMARESPANPDVEKIEREFTARDLAYCDMQGTIFMAAIDRGIPMDQFAPVYMNSQLAGVIDYSFSLTGGMETDDISEFLRIPVLLKSPQLIVDVVMWLDSIVKGTVPGESINMAVVKACMSDNGIPAATEQVDQDADDEKQDSLNPGLPTDEKALTDLYEYAYWLGYIYRCECHMHDESSRMVYGAFDETFMREFYQQLSLDNETSLIDCAREICHRMDALLIGKLWR